MPAAAGYPAPVSWPADPLGVLAPLLALGWVVRVPPISREEGHEAITRAAWEGLSLTPQQQRALIRGVRAPDVGLGGFLVSALPFAQRRHALRAWSATSTRRGVEEMRAYMAECHARALAMPDGPRRWSAFGRLLHCLQDSYSPAHTDRDGGRIQRMKHWGPMRSGPRGDTADEHGFPADPRDSAWRDGSLTDEARAAVAASRAYLELAVAEASAGFLGFLDSVASFPEVD
jgi:hypothetical protein